MNTCIARRMHRSHDIVTLCKNDTLSLDDEIKKTTITEDKQL